MHMPIDFEQRKNPSGRLHRILDHTEFKLFFKYPIKIYISVNAHVEKDKQISQDESINIPNAMMNGLQFCMSL